MAQQSMCAPFSAAKRDAGALCVARGQHAEAICHGQATSRARARGRPRGRQTALLLALALVAGAEHARAAPLHCPEPEAAAASLAAVDAQARLAWIDRRLSATASRSSTWAWLWGSGIAASGVASLIAVPFVATEQRVDWYASAISAGIGVLPFVLLPPRVIRDSNHLQRELRLAPATPTPQQLCPLLADAEARLTGGAEEQRQQQAWWVHAANLGFNLSVFLVLGLGYGHWTAGAINGGAGAVVGEAIILTRPTSSIDDLRSYRAGEIAPLGAPPRAFLRYSAKF
jgi:hypothetical protein